MAHHITISECCELYSEWLREGGKASWRMALYQTRRIRELYGSKPARELDEADLLEYRRRRRGEVTPAAINRDISWLRAAMRRAARTRRWNPETERKEPLLDLNDLPIFELPSEASRARRGFLEPAQFERLRRFLPPLQGDIALFAYLSCWRRGEVLGLVWPEVDWNRLTIYLPPERSKNHHGRLLPLEGRILDVIRRRWEVRLPGIDAIWHRYGRPVRDIRGAWERACQRAGFPGLRFHDLRRSGVRNLIRAGVERKVARDVSGHKTDSIYDRYNITSEGDLREAMGKLGGYFEESREAGGGVA